MTESNAELARRAYAAFNQGALPFELLGSEIEWRNPQEAPEAAVFRGHDGVRRYLDLTFEMFEWMRNEPLEFIEEGDRLLVVVRILGRARGTGMELDAVWSHLWTIRDGKATRLQMFLDRESGLEALRAA